MTSVQLLEHIVVTVVGWSIGTGIGLITGKALKPLLQKIDSLIHQGRFGLLLIPWRTVIASILLINLYPVSLIIRFGIGIQVGIFSVAIVMFLLTIMIVGETSKTTPNYVPFSIRSTSWLRSLAVLTVVVVSYYGDWGGGRLGFLSRMYISTLQYKEFAALIGYIAGIALAIDLMLGIFQYQFHKRGFQPPNQPD